MASKKKAASSKRNGKKGGRPRGRLNDSTILKKKMHERFIEKAEGHMDEVIDALIASAVGFFYEEEYRDKKGNIKTRTYTTKPNPRAIAEYFDRVLGKAIQPHKVDGEIDLNHEIDKRTEELLSELKSNEDRGPSTSKNTGARKKSAKGAKKKVSDRGVSAKK